MALTGTRPATVGDNQPFASQRDGSMMAPDGPMAYKLTATADNSVELMRSSRARVTSPDLTQSLLLLTINVATGRKRRKSLRSIDSLPRPGA